MKRFTTTFPRDLWIHRRCSLHASSQTGQAVVASRPASAAQWNLALLDARAQDDGQVEGGGAEVTILSPAQGAAYVLSGVAGGDRIPLTALGAPEAALHWFMDGRYLGVGREGVPLLWPLEGGEHSVTVQLSDGRRDSTTFTVLRPDEGDETP